MDLKLIFLWLSLILFFISYNPFFPYPHTISWYLTFAGIISSSYIFIFVVYFFVKDYEKIKEFLSSFLYKATSHLIHKNRNLTLDLLKFSLISILIILFIDVTLTKLSEQSYVKTLLGLIPGLQEPLQKMIQEENKEDRKTTTSWEESWEEFQKFKSLQYIVIFFGPILGPVILFFLRKISYKKHSSNRLQNPGGRILLFFFVISSIALVSDLYSDIVENGIYLNESVLSTYVNESVLSTYVVDIDYQINGTYNNMNEDNKGDSDGLVRYTFSHLILFIFKNLVYGSFYISIVSIWIFDQYIFSKLGTK